MVDQCTGELCEELIWATCRKEGVSTIAARLEFFACEADDLLGLLVGVLRRVDVLHADIDLAVEVEVAADRTGLRALGRLQLPVLHGAVFVDLLALCEL